MPAITRCELPEHALLSRYAGTSYTDCYSMDVSSAVGMSDYIRSFYTSRVFKIERALLGLFARRPATDHDALELALGNVARFSAWAVEDRTTDQILLRDFSGHTRSWLMCAPLQSGPGVRLYFGSAVIPRSHTENGEPAFSRLFHILSNFHHWYTKILMRAAYVKLAVNVP